MTTRLTTAAIFLFVLLSITHVRDNSKAEDAVVRNSTESSESAIPIAPRSALSPVLRKEGDEAPTYAVRAGDTLIEIARREGISVHAILEENPYMSDPNKLQIGQIIALPLLRRDTGPEHKEISIQGVLTDDGQVCQTLLGSNNRTYALIGDVGPHRSGDVVQIEGIETETSDCSLGTAIEILEIILPDRIPTI